jgi:hypothetical protein
LLAEEKGIISSASNVPACIASTPCSRANASYRRLHALCTLRWCC